MYDIFQLIIGWIPHPPSGPGQGLKIPDWTIYPFLLFVLTPLFLAIASYLLAVHFIFEYNRKLNSLIEGARFDRELRRYGLSLRTKYLAWDAPKYVGGSDAFLLNIRNLLVWAFDARRCGRRLLRALRTKLHRVLLLLLHFLFGFLLAKPELPKYKPAIAPAIRLHEYIFFYRLGGATSS
jgi:hypothetical protein